MNFSQYLLQFEFVFELNDLRIYNWIMLIVYALKKYITVFSHPALISQSILILMTAIDQKRFRSEDIDRGLCFMLMFYCRLLWPQLIKAIWLLQVIWIICTHMFYT